MEISPHDLLQIHVKPYEKELTSWALQSLNKAPWVVVRRDETTNIPVGIRGHKRNQRLAFEISLQDVIKKVTPYHIFKQKMWERLPVERKSLTGIKALSHIYQQYPTLPFGVGGSVGFECVTHQESIQKTSDLDLLLYLPEKVSQENLQQWQLFFEKYPVHIDVQIITLGGGFSLQEWLNKTTRTILVKTKSGPVLVEDPWKIEGKR
ncbi:malonate decarboxylase holo-ACP synthase [Listeria sp. PSOL-1]|uniref:malonate decarboxylase holo-ACP synthase n=1 Tax=Listeria sp. PSOL-1 TaxID=1844999 RepID=UPI0013D413A6|nr:malonate decarboxylase holo-ACP synthase [Listeria sp. PSOL-1]